MVVAPGLVGGVGPHGLPMEMAGMAMEGWLGEGGLPLAVGEW